MLNPTDIIVDNIFLLLKDFSLIVTKQLIGKQNNVIESWKTLYYPHGPSNVLWIEFKFRIRKVLQPRNFFKPTKPGREQGQGGIISEAKNQILKN